MSTTITTITTIATITTITTITTMARGLLLPPWTPDPAPRDPRAKQLQGGGGVIIITGTLGFYMVSGP